MLAMGGDLRRLRQDAQDANRPDCECGLTRIIRSVEGLPCHTNDPLDTKSASAVAFERCRRQGACAYGAELVPRWEPPELRRRLIVEDHDSGKLVRTVIDMHATPRIDSYLVRIDGKAQAGRMGWSRILGLLRVAMPRKCSTMDRRVRWRAAS